jgi:hypothetical protein
MALIHDIETAKRRKNITLALLIDVKGAFDPKYLYYKQWQNLDCLKKLLIGRTIL